MHSMVAFLLSRFLALTYQDGHLITYGGLSFGVNASAEGSSGRRVTIQTVPPRSECLDKAPLWIGNNPENQGGSLQKDPAYHPCHRHL